MSGLHFRITEGTIHHFYLALVIVLAAFVGAMTVILLSSFGSNLSSYSPGTFLRQKETTLSIAADQSTVKSGETFTATVYLDTRLPTTGVNILLRYDPRMLRLEGSSPGLSSAPAYLNTAQSSFGIFPIVEAGTDAHGAIIAFSALARPVTEVRGNAVVAALRFRALQPGETSVVVVFDPDLPQDSDVAYHGKDILERTNNLVLVIQ